MPEELILPGDAPKWARIACAYCGYSKLKHLALCTAENCRKWFCNGTTADLHKSHALVHAGHSKHTALALFKSSLPAGMSYTKLKKQDHAWIEQHLTFRPECVQCRWNNIFDLGVQVPGNRYDRSLCVCRRHAVFNDNIARDLWNPLVASHIESDRPPPGEVFFSRIASWILGVPLKVDMMAVNHKSLIVCGLRKLERREVDLLEQFWRFSPNGTKQEFLLWKRTEEQRLGVRVPSENVPKVKLSLHAKERCETWVFSSPTFPYTVECMVGDPQQIFSDKCEYAFFWNQHVEELSRQEKGTVETLPSMRNLKYTWINSWDVVVEVPQGIFTEHLELGRPLSVSYVRVDKGVEAEIWDRDATLSGVTVKDCYHEVKVHVLSPVNRTDHRILQGLQFKFQYNDINYWRMQQALFKFVYDPMSVSKRVADCILGRTSSEELPESGVGSELESTSFAPSESVDGMEEEESEDEFEVPMPRTMNTTNRKSEPPPFHTEYIKTDIPFRYYHFTKVLCPNYGRVYDERQKQAVQMALAYPVCLVQGPPGTGKTQTAAAIVANLAQDEGGKILCCAPSNVAIDNLTMKIAELGKNLKILRLVAHTRDASNLDPGVIRFTVMDMFRRQRKREKKKKEIDEWEIRRFEREMVEECQIICCTCNASLSAGLFALEKVHFPYVVIDEAAQAMEPDCLIPITRACEKLVLIGDPKQLGACIKFSNLQRSQLATSLFGRLWLKAPSIMLAKQYRMAPEIRKMVSEITYEGLLVDAESVVNRPPPSRLISRLFLAHSKPILFVDVCRNDELSGSGTSYVNVNEGHFIARLVANVLHEADIFGALAAGFPKPLPSDIGIITFYNGQRPHMRVQMEHHNRIKNVVEEVEINSVDGFQGREKEIIILSCVRSANGYWGKKTLGFTDDPQRLNVALSRAKRALIVVGNYEVFQNSPVWRQYFKYVPVQSVAEVCQKLSIACSCKKLPCKVCPEAVVRDAPPRRAR